MELLRSDLRAFVGTSGAVLAATIVRWSLDEHLGALALFSPFYIAVVVGARLGGLRPALYATFTGLVIYAVFFADGLFAIGMYDTLIALTLYAIVCISIAFFGEALHRERRKAVLQAERLRLVEERSTRAQRGARIGVWESDLITGTCYFSSEFRNIHGMGMGPFTLDRIFDALHPDDLNMEKERFKEALANKEEEWVSLGRFIHPQLGLRWRYGRARIEYELSGVAARMSGTMMDVTDQQEAKDLLRQVEERSSRAQQVAQAGTWELDLVNGRAYVSSEFCQLIGAPFTPELPLEDLFSILHPEDQPLFRENFERTLQKKQSRYRNESRHVLPDGQIKWRMARGEVIYNAAGVPVSIVGATIDVTDRKLTELALQNSEKRFRLATEAINGMLYDQDLVTGTVQRSDGLHELMGVRSTDAPCSEEWWISRIHPNDRARTLEQVRNVHREQQALYDLEYRLEHADGHWIWVNDKGRLSYNDKGDLLRVVGCVTNISVRKKAEVELQNADRRKDEFLATLAHELRNPLAPLHHAIDLLDDVASDRQMLTDLRSMMQRQMRHLIRLVDDLMDLSRISRGKIELRRDHLDLCTCVHTAIEANRHSLQQLSHELFITMPEAPCMVNGDLERLTQVFSNLLNNAAKFTPAGGRIEVTLQEVGDHALLEVKDNGIGMNDEALERVFDMFVQAGDRSKVRSSNGLGIGLNLVRRLVVMHGGSVSAHSAGEGMGATIRVKLPLATAFAAREQKVNDLNGSIETIGEMPGIS